MFQELAGMGGEGNEGQGRRDLAVWFQDQLLEIKTKLDSMVTEVHQFTRGTEQRLVRLEERDSHRESALGRAFSEIKELRDKVVTLEVQQQVPNRVSGWVIAGGGVVAGIIITAIVAKVLAG